MATGMGRTQRDRSRAASWILAALGALSTPLPAFAQEDAPSAAPGDVVRLKDGSFYRGTILELVAGDHVDLRLASGQVKHFEMDDVKYAGSADEAPARPAPERPSRAAERLTPRPFVTIDAERAHIHFVSDPPDLDLSIRSEDATATNGWGGSASARGYTRICAAPCDATLPTGRHRMALSIRGKTPIEAHDPVALDGPARIRGVYTENGTIRAVGWVVIGTSVVAGTILIVVGASPTKQQCTTPGDPETCFTVPAADTGLEGAGLAVMGLGALTGLVMILQHDHATFEVTPVDAALRLPSPVAREGGWLTAASPAPYGLGVRIRF